MHMMDRLSFLGRKRGTLLKVDYFHRKEYHYTLSFLFNYQLHINSLPTQNPLTMSPLSGACLFINILILFSQLHKASAASHAAGRSIPTYGRCTDTCGSIPVKFPFGTGFGCGHPYFARYVKCSGGALQFSTGTGIYTVSSIDYPTSSIVVADPFMSTCSSMQNSGSFSLDRASPFTLTGDNIFVLLGCSTTSPVFDPSEDLCDTGSGSRVCSGLYSCKGVTGIGLPQNAPTSTCCVYDSLMGVGSGYSLDLPKLQCSSYTSIYEFGDEGDPMKWKFGISLQYNDSYYTPACTDCETSGGLCGFSGLDESFSCICRDGVNTTTTCVGHGFSWSGAWEPKIQTKTFIGGIIIRNFDSENGFGSVRGVAGKGKPLYEDHAVNRKFYLKYLIQSKMFVVGMTGLRLIFWTILLVLAILQNANSHGVQPLSRIGVHKATFALDNRAYVKASPDVLGLNGQNTEWVTVEYSSQNPSIDDWIGVFSPANFSASTCLAENPRVTPPLLCSAPIKYQYANYSSPDYKDTGKGSMKLLLINQRSDFSFALFSSGLLNPKLVALSNTVSFTNPNAPVYPRLAQGKEWNEMTVTWTSGYGIDEAEPFVQWGPKGEHRQHSPAVTLTFGRNSMCGAPARTVGWRDPGYIHTSFLKELWPNRVYTYKLGHRLFNSTYIWSQEYQFKASPFPGQNSLQHVVIFGDMGKDEADGSNEYNNFQRGSLNTTNQLIKDLNNIDIVFHIGDICYANGYLSQWDQFTAQIEPIASAVPYMLASGNHERDWPGTGSFYENMDSGGECGVLAETMFFVPAENRAKYSTDYGMFRFCIADTEHDWREGTEQYKFIEHCLASVDRQKQPWLIFLAHRVLGYSSGISYAIEGSFAEPMARESLQKLWQKYKVDISIYGHVHNYERTCPIYENRCTDYEKHYYKGTPKGTIHVVAGGGGASLSTFTTLKTNWSLYRDYDYGFVKLTAFDHSNLLFEYKKSSDGKVYDTFRISRDYRDILACTVDSCPSTTLAS
ncbi:Calcineurin-like phosphoesterase domain [Theobroma cacao]|nr:Calcineurin-like phosphoesterase domain [Theobroma cacao]